VFVFNNLHTAANTTTASFASTWNGGTSFSSIGAGLKGYNGTTTFADYEFVAWATSGASPGTGKTITATFTNGATDQAWLQVVELGCNDTSNPIAQSAYSTISGTTQSNPYTANLPAGPIQATNFDVYFVNAHENITAVPGATPTPTPATLTLQSGGGGGTADTFWASTPRQNESFNTSPSSSKHWGTIAVEIKRP